MSEKPSSLATCVAAFALSVAFVFSILAIFLVYVGASRPTTADTVPMLYRIRLHRVPNDMTENLRVGDIVIDSVTKTPLGHVTSVEEQPTRLESVKNGRVIVHRDPRLSEVTLTLSAPLTADGHTKDGCLLRAGQELHLRMPLYQGSGICLGLLTSA